jgi:hypothetical protein
MFHIRKEGQRIENGFNFYPLSDKSNFGFIFRYGPRMPVLNLGLYGIQVRYSKVHKQWFIHRYDSNITPGQFS